MPIVTLINDDASVWQSMSIMPFAFTNQMNCKQLLDIFSFACATDRLVDVSDFLLVFLFFFG